MGEGFSSLREGTDQSKSNFQVLVCVMFSIRNWQNLIKSQFHIQVVENQNPFLSRKIKLCCIGTWILGTHEQIGSAY